MVKTLRKRGGFTLIELLLCALPTLFILGCWVVNLVKLCKCDFAAPYKGEVIHAIGLVGPASVVTVWFDDK